GNPAILLIRAYISHLPPHSNSLANRAALRRLPFTRRRRRSSAPVRLRSPFAIPTHVSVPERIRTSGASPGSSRPPSHAPSATLTHQLPPRSPDRSTRYSARSPSARS